MDLDTDTARIWAKDVALNLTTSGHYCIPIDRVEKMSVEQVFAANFEEMDCKERHKTLIKLHRQFAHPPLKKLKALLQDAGQWKHDYQEILEDIGEKCNLCKKYMITPPRPSVGLPMASQFNEKVAMDLKHWNGQWILHNMDIWSRYTISIFTPRKRSCDVINALMQGWIAVFGVMEAILTDNGGEFGSNEMREVMSILNVQVITTAADSPFQN